MTTVSPNKYIQTKIKTLLNTENFTSNGKPVRVQSELSDQMFSQLALPIVGVQLPITQSQTFFTSDTCKDVIAVPVSLYDAFKPTHTGKQECQERLTLLGSQIAKCIRAEIESTFPDLFVFANFVEVDFFTPDEGEEMGNNLLGYAMVITFPIHYPSDRVFTE